MPEALAASDNDIVVREPAPKSNNLWQRLGAPKKRAARTLRRRGRRLAPYLLFGFFAVSFTLILLNALFWQKTRHSGPLLFSRVAPSATVKVARSATRTEPAAAKHGQPAQDETQKNSAGQGPDELPQTRSYVPAPAARDQISEILQSTSPSAAAPPEKPLAGAPNLPTAGKAVLNAQRALVKLGFILKPDGISGNATRQAIARYEQEHGLPVRGVLTPALMRRLTAEAGIAR